MGGGGKVPGSEVGGGGLGALTYENDISAYCILKGGY